MSQGKHRLWWVAGCLLALALVGAVLIAGCGKKANEAGTATDTGQATDAVATPYAEPTPAQPANQPAQPRPAQAPAVSGAEQANRLRQFASEYGPVTVTEEQNWDGRTLKFVTFTYKAQGKPPMAVRMPLRMVLDASDPKMLAGYFQVYRAAGQPTAKVISKATVTATTSPEELARIAELPAEQQQVAAVAAPQPAAASATGPAAPAGGGGRGPGMRGGGGRGPGMGGGGGRGPGMGGGGGRGPGMGGRMR